MRDLFDIGPQKPMGYLPILTIEECGHDPNLVCINLVKERKLYAKFFTQEECGVWTGALYAADITALEKLLQKNVSILERTGWPTKGEDFVANVARVSVSDDHETGDLYGLIGRAFGDPRFTKS